jgi:hypothetical protein
VGSEFNKLKAKKAYTPRGKTPEVQTVGGTHQKLSMIDSVNNRGKAHWMIHRRVL